MKMQQQPTVTNNPSYLHPEVNRLLNNFTKYVSKPLGLDKPYAEDKTKREVEYASSLILQILLYFNVYYFPCWFLANCFLWPVTIAGSSQVFIILTLFAFIIMVIFEGIRLYLAYIGNLRERVPELTGFWLLTLIIELPLCIFLLIVVWFIEILIPLQFALELVHAIFIILEVVFGYIALRILARYQISRFHYKQFDMNNENVDNNNKRDAAEFNWIPNLKSADNITTLKANIDKME